MPCDGIAVRQGTSTFIEVRASRFLPDDLLAALAAHDDVLAIRRIHPVLPVLSRKELAVPFITCAEMLDYNRGRDLRLWELAVAYESMRGGLAPDEVVERMRAIVRIMARAIAQGMEGTAYADRILGAQSLGYQRQLRQGTLLADDLLNQVVLRTSAMMEVKSAMGVIVAAPTAGSCGALPGAVLGAGAVKPHRGGHQRVGAAGAACEQRRGERGSGDDPGGDAPHGGHPYARTSSSISLRRVRTSL
jgi:L-serine dehydratase